MKEYDYNDPMIVADPSLSSIIEERRDLVSEVLGKSAGLVRAKWTARQDERGRPLIDLRLSDWTFPEGVTKSFAAWELDDRWAFRDKLHDLWGDLLFGKFHKSIEKLQAIPVSEVESDSR